MIAALVLLGAAAAHAAPCPADFVDQLSGDALTKLQKRDMGAACKGARITLAGKVLNVDRDAKGVVKVRVDVPLRQPRPLTPADVWEVTLVEPNACGDPSKINRGDRVALAAQFGTYEGFMNEQATASGGNCR